MSYETNTAANPPDSSIYIPSHMPESAGKFPAASMFQDAILPEDEQAPPEEPKQDSVDMKRIIMMILLSVLI